MRTSTPQSHSRAGVALVMAALRDDETAMALLLDAADGASPVVHHRTAGAQ